MEQKLIHLEEKMYWQFQRLSRLRPPRANMPQGVTPTEMFALRLIADLVDRGEQARPGAIASQMRVSKSALSQIIRSLEEKELVTRERDLSDSRVVLLEITDKGRAAMEEMKDNHSKSIRQFTEYLGVEDMETMVKLLDKIAVYMEKYGDVAPECAHPHPPFFGKPHFHGKCECQGGEGETCDGNDGKGGDAQ